MISIENNDGCKFNSGNICDNELNIYRQHRQNSTPVNRKGSALSVEQKKMEYEYHNQLKQQHIENSQKISTFMKNNLSTQTVSNLNNFSRINY